MRESRTSGSGRGDQGNPVPYRHRISPLRTGVSELLVMPEAVGKRAIRGGRCAVFGGQGVEAPV